MVLRKLWGFTKMNDQERVVLDDLNTDIHEEIKIIELAELEKEKLKLLHKELINIKEGINELHKKRGENSAIGLTDHILELEKSLGINMEVIKKKIISENYDIENAHRLIGNIKNTINSMKSPK